MPKISSLSVVLKNSEGEKWWGDREGVEHYQNNHLSGESG